MLGLLRPERVEVAALAACVEHPIGDRGRAVELVNATGEQRWSCHLGVEQGEARTIDQRDHAWYQGQSAQHRLGQAILPDDVAGRRIEVLQATSTHLPVKEGSSATGHVEVLSSIPHG